MRTASDIDTEAAWALWLRCQREAASTGRALSASPWFVDHRAVDEFGMRHVRRFRLNLPRYDDFGFRLIEENRAIVARLFGFP